MRAIIIDDKDAQQLLRDLDLEKFKGAHDPFAEHIEISEQQRNSIVDQIHRKFHYVVCNWLQEQGADTVRR